MVPRNIVSPQSNKPVMGIVQVSCGVFIEQRCVEAGRGGVLMMALLLSPSTIVEPFVEFLIWVCTESTGLYSSRTRASSQRWGYMEEGGGSWMTILYIRRVQAAVHRATEMI